MKYAFGTFVLVGALIACSPKTTTEVITEVEEVTTTEETMSAEMLAGKSVYDSRCIKCHGAKKIEDYSKKEWEIILPNMMDKAKLTAEERTQVHAYVFGNINE